MARDVVGYKGKVRDICGLVIRIVKDRAGHREGIVMLWYNSGKIMQEL